MSLVMYKKIAMFWVYIAGSGNVAHCLRNWLCGVIDQLLNYNQPILAGDVLTHNQSMTLPEKHKQYVTENIAIHTSS